MKKVILSFMLVFIFGSSFNLFGFGGRDKEPDFTLANGTGSKISRIQITPCNEKYPDNGKEFNLDKLDFKDTDVLSIFLPADMKRFDTFNITVLCGLRRFNTTQSIGISKGSVLELSKKGRDSTFTAATADAAVGGVLAVYSMNTILIDSVVTNGGASLVTWVLLKVGGAIVVGTVSAGKQIAVTAVRSIVWGASGLFPGELVVSEINYKEVTI